MWKYHEISWQSAKALDVVFQGLDSKRFVVSLGSRCVCGVEGLDLDSYAHSCGWGCYTAQLLLGCDGTIHIQELDDANTNLRRFISKQVANDYQ
jgi:hypothetical protein